MPGLAHHRPYEVLLVEDNPGDVRLVMEAMGEGKMLKSIHVAQDGVQAMDFLMSRKAGGLPDLILLDLNLPRKNGHEVLAAIRADAALRRTPVIVFTSSAADQDIRTAYELNANCYVVKPSGFSELMETIRGIESFWLHTATLPYRSREPHSY